MQRNGRHGVRFSQGWRERPDRKVFSLSVESTGLQDIRATPHLPPWFENLIFEGEMRRWITASEPGLGGDDMSFLARIGLDLVGAVTLAPVADEVDLTESLDTQSPPMRIPSGRIRWSLAGVQLKLNLAVHGERFTLPVHGELGRFIAKFADKRYRGVPANEFATMCWGRAAGIDCAEVSLIEASRIDDLPEAMTGLEEPVLLVRRFDREDDRRVHAEEFSQVLGIRPQEKYNRFGWRHHLRILAEAAPMDIAQYLRRLLFVIASGNGDAHHKNWSLIYPDGRQPRLSPAYDQVATVAWTRGDRILWDNLPFKLHGTRRWEEVRLHSVSRLIDKVGIDRFEDQGTLIESGGFERWIRQQIEHIQDTLSSVLPIAPPGYMEAVHAHWARVPLLRGSGLP